MKKKSIQALLSAQDIEMIDRFVRRGIFLNRSDAIRAAVRMLPVMRRFSLFDFSMSEMIKATVNRYLTLKVGDRTYAGEPKEVMKKGLLFYEVPVMISLDGVEKLLGRVYVDRTSIQVVKELSDSPKKLREKASELNA